MIDSLYQHTNTIVPAYLRRANNNPHDNYDLNDAKRACASFNDHSPRFIVDGKNRDVVYAKRGFREDDWGHLEVVFRKNPERSTDEESWFDVELEVWLGCISHAFDTHRLVLGINGLLVRPFDNNEWMKFQTGPHRDGTVLHFTLLYDESISRLLRWEKDALDRIEAIDTALSRYTLRYDDSGVTVTKVAPPTSDGLQNCGLIGDDHRGSARVLLPEWFWVGVFQLGLLDAPKPLMTFRVSDEKPTIILTPRNLKKGGIPPHQEVVLRIHPSDYLIFR